MPLLEDHDLARTAADLTRWLAGRLADGSEPHVEQIAPPAGTGFSGDTLLVRASWRADGRRQAHELALRSEPRTFRVVADTDLAHQADVLRVLYADGRVPVPRVLWFEPDPGPLGSPFMITERLPGRAPADQPPYHEAGWFHDATASDRAAMWWAAVDVVAAVHAAPAALPHPADSLGKHLDRLAAQRAWTGAAGELALFTRADDWLRANRPRPHADPVLLWGDARLGNVLFEGTRATGALDWEKAMIGPAELDVAWFLYVDRHHSQGCRLSRLSGLPDPAQTVRGYEQRTGRTLRDLAWFEVLAAYTFALLMVRAVALLVAAGRLADEVGAGYVQDNSATVLLARCLTEHGVG